MIRYEHLRQMGVALNRAAHFIVCPGQPGCSPAVKTEYGHPSPIAIAPGRTLSVAVPRTPARLPVLLTDGTFEGLLSAVFEAYARKADSAQIRPRKQHRPGLFEESVLVAADTQNAERVWKGLKRHLGSDQSARLYLAFLTGEQGVEILIYRYIRAAIPSKAKLVDSGSPAVHLAIERLSQKALREAHRMKGRVRFSKMENDLFMALINPRYDVLPLIRRHFEKRYADQRWVIFDAVRNYGLFFDTEKTSEVRTGADLLPSGVGSGDTADETCRQLWKTYFAAVDIAERHNPKLHLRWLPRRYWRYLPEKN